MTVNVGTADRALRLVLGAALVLWALLAGGWSLWAWAALVAGAVLVITGATRVCPLYSLLGLSTCPVRR